jgi:hypothetical protein
VNAVTCRFWHRWGRWEVEFEECPDGEMGVYAFRTRRCRRKGCNMIEEEWPRCVSLSPEVVRGLIR